MPQPDRRPSEPPPGAAFRPAQAQRWNMLGGFQGVLSSPGAQRELWGWCVLALLSLGLAGVFALLLAVTILYYVFIYTMWLKRRTSQNIVIGGAAGAFPPMIGWTAVTSDIGLGSVALFAIIFLWTPPHSWALALFRRGDYEAAGVPMMPVVASERETKRQILIYTALLVPVTLSPVALGVSGGLYGVAAAGLGVEFLRRCWLLWKDEGVGSAKSLFLFSILYLFLIFVALIIDRAFPIPIF